MKMMNVAAALMAVGFLACGDDPETIVELTVTETVPVPFGAMDAGVAKEAVTGLASLLDEPNYADAADALRCGSLDAAVSGFRVTRLDVAQGATVANMTVEIAPLGSTRCDNGAACGAGVCVPAPSIATPSDPEPALCTNAAFQQLGGFQGSVAQGDFVTFVPPKGSVNSAALSTLSQTVLGAEPALAVRIVAEVPGVVNDFSVDTILALAFSSEAGACPSLETGQ